MADASLRQVLRDFAKEENRTDQRETDATRGHLSHAARVGEQHTYSGSPACCYVCQPFFSLSLGRRDLRHHRPLPRSKPSLLKLAEPKRHQYNHAVRTHTNITSTARSPRRGARPSRSFTQVRTPGCLAAASSPLLLLLLLPPSQNYKK